MRRAHQLRPGIILAAAAWLTLSPLAGQSAGTRSANGHITHRAGNLAAIRQALSQHHLRRARSWLGDYLRAHPDSAPAWTLSGMLADSAGDYHRGGADLLRARQLAPGPGAWSNWGNHLLLAGHPRQARTAWRQALALAPGDADARFNLVRELLREPACQPAASAAKPPAAKKITGAPACARQALAAWQGFSAIQKRQPAMIELVVRAQLAGRQDAAARKLARAALRREPARARTRLAASLGLDFLRAGDDSAARHWLKIAHAAQPDSTRLRLALAQAELPGCVRTRQTSAERRANDCYRRTLAALAALHGQRPAWWRPDYWLGRAMIRQGRRMQAAGWLLRAEAAAPRQPMPYAALASVLTAEGFWRDAAGQWRHYLRLAPQDARAWQELAVNAQLAGQGQLAQTAMRRYLKAQPQDARAWYLMSLIEQGQGDLAGSRAELRRTLRLDPRYAPAWSSEAKQQMAANHLRRARRDLARALAAQPDYAPALARLGKWETRRGHPELALPLLQRAARLAPRRVATWYLLAQCYLRLHDARQARAAQARFQRLSAQQNVTKRGTAPGILDWLRTDLRLSPAARQKHYRAFLRQALAAMPDNPRVRCRLGLAYLAAQRTAQALPLLRAALSPRLPASDDVAAATALAAAGDWQLGAAYEQAALGSAKAETDAAAILDWARQTLRAGHPHIALSVLARVPANTQPRGAAAELAALIYARLGQNNHAWAAFRVALRLNPRQPGFYRDAAVFLGSRRDWRPALALLELGGQQCPGSQSLAFERAVLLQLSGRRVEAQQQLRKLAAEPALHNRAETLLAISFYTTDRKARALELFTRLTRSDPNNSTAWYYLGLLRYEAGRRRQALLALRQALRRQPNDAAARYLAGQLLLARRHFAAAERDFRAAAAARPNWPEPHYQLSHLYMQQGRRSAARQEQQKFQQLNRTAPAWKRHELQAYLDSLAANSRPPPQP